MKTSPTLNQARPTPLTTSVRSRGATSPPSIASFSDWMQSLSHQHHTLGQVILQAAHGQQFSDTRVLQLQADVYRYAQQVELYSRLVDKSLSAVKTVLTIQV